MSSLYIDYTRSVPANQTKVHGGAVYSRTLLINLIRYLESNPLSKKIFLLWPEGYSPNSEIEKTIYNSPCFNILQVNRLSNSIEFESGSTLFIPLLAVKDYPVLKELKKKNVDVVLTIHGLRQLDFKFDSYDLKYELGLLSKIKVLIQEVFLPIKKYFYRRYLKKYTRYADTIITVSNFTLAGLVKLCNVNDVILQYEDANLTQIDFEVSKTERLAEEYILFVSGNRPEKNLARSIEAYKKYVRKCDCNIPMYIVGSSEKTKKALVKSLNLKSMIEKERVVFFDYVDDEKLASLYKNATFLLYTSKSEGFGLPALEAAKYECPVVAAYGTSIPEVLGPNCIYVNPYSVDSIADGIIRLTKEKERKMIKQKLKAAFKNTLPRIHEGNMAVIQRLLR